MENYSEMFEEYFKDYDQYLVLSFKKNYDDLDVDNIDYDMLGDDIMNVKIYLTESKIEVLASTAGIHFNGMNKVPHIHYALIVSKKSCPKTFLSQPSLHRKRAANSADLSHFSMKSDKFSNKKPKYFPLSYPLKEGYEVKSEQRHLFRYDKQPMKPAMIDFLKGIGNSIYEEELAKNLIRDKSAERKQNDYLELLNLVRDSGIKFPNYRNLQIWAEDNYIDKIDPEAMIDIQNYKKNLNKVGVALKICKTYDI